MFIFHRQIKDFSLTWAKQIFFTGRSARGVTTTAVLSSAMLRMISFHFLQISTSRSMTFPRNFPTAVHPRSPSGSKSGAGEMHKDDCSTDSDYYSSAFTNHLISKIATACSVVEQLTKSWFALPRCWWTKQKKIRSHCLHENGS